jgi:mycofactocin system FadH/OYE family oxidoreductase 1
VGPAHQRETAPAAVARSAATAHACHHDVVRLLEPITLNGRTAPNRLMFGPHVTNLGNGRALSDRHTRYYERRAAGGCGIVVLEEASAHPLDWPYERAPLASAAEGGWSACASAIHRHGSLAIAALGHAGGQGSSAYSQRELMAPSRVLEVAAREVPKWMEASDIADVVDGFRDASTRAARADLDGVEVNAGQFSLVRQFLSGLTNHRGDEWGADRLLFARSVLEAVRSGIGHDRIVGLRLSCDELAPWAGITPELAEPIVAALAPLCDYIVVVRGSIYSTAATRPDGHEPPGFNRELTARMKSSAAATPIGLQGSIVDAQMAEDALSANVCDFVEMTRSQLADPDLGNKLARGAAPRPCVLCNQWCIARDARNPIVSCIVEPSTGHEHADPPWAAVAAPNARKKIVVVGAGPAGAEAAITAAGRGHSVRILERHTQSGGAARTSAHGSGRDQLARLIDWQADELVRLGVEIEYGAPLTDDTAGLIGNDECVVMAVGAVASVPDHYVGGGVAIVDVAAALDDPSLVASGTVVINDTIGGPIGISLAELLGSRAVLVTQDQIAGNELSRSGDLAPANVRLAQQGVAIERRAVVRSVTPASGGGIEVVLEDRFNGEHRTIHADVYVYAGHRLPSPVPTVGRTTVMAGDCVAPRSIGEAILEGRRAVLAIERSS